MDHIFIILPGRMVTRPAGFGRTRRKSRGGSLVAAVGGKADAIRTDLRVFADTGYGAGYMGVVLCLEVYELWYKGDGLIMSRHGSHNN